MTPPSSRIRTHIRNNLWGIIALSVALGGTAHAVDGPLPGQNQVGSEDIINNDILSRDIADGKIFNVDLADNLITGQKLKDGTVTGADLADAAVAGGTGGKLADNTITAHDLANNSVIGGAGGEVLDNSLTGADVSEVDLDLNVLQARVGGSCPSGQAIRNIDPTGSVTCQPTVSSVAAGKGLRATPSPITGAGTVSLDYSTSISNAPLGVNETVFGERGTIFEGPVADDFETEFVAPNQTADRTLLLPNRTGELSALGQSIETPEIEDDAVTSAKVGPNALTGQDIDEASLSSVGRVYWTAGGVSGNLGTQETVVESLFVPAGSYLATANFFTDLRDSNDGSGVRKAILNCELRPPPGTPGVTGSSGSMSVSAPSVNGATAPNTGQMTLSPEFTAVWTLDDPGVIELRCDQQETGPFVAISGARIQALPVGSAVFVP